MDTLESTAGIAAPGERRRRSWRWPVALLIVLALIAGFDAYLTAPRPGARMDPASTGPDGAHFHVPVSGALHMNSTLGLMHALLAGVGASAVPEYFTWEATRDGLLVDLFPDWAIASSPICIVTPPGRARPARVRVLLEFLREQFSSLPWAQGIER